MGFGSSWKRMSEKTKQALGMKGGAKGEWKPTSNERNEAMITDARKFAKQLKALHRELVLMHKHIEGSFGVFKSVLNAPLPRIYELSDKGPIPVEKSTMIVGTGVSFENLMASSSDLKAKLQQEVLKPLEQWLSAYRQIKTRNLKCEEIRLELDAKRRLAANMHVTFERQKSRATTPASAGGAPPAPETLNDPTADKLQHAEYKLATEEDKVARLTQRFKDVEEEVFNALRHLIADTSVLKQYAAASLIVYKGAFEAAYGAFDLSAPNPAQLAPQPSGVSVSGPAGAPAWYQQAKDNPGTLNYDSDDDKA